MDKSAQLFERAKKVMPGGVNSPVRAFNAVGGAPRFIKSAKGARIFDEDGRQYIDYVGSWGPMILGHANDEILEAVKKACDNGLSFGAATEAEVIMAELAIKSVGFISMIRMVNSGTEAVMSALRLARGYTGRNKIIKFEGCYHGHCDSMLVKAGSGALTNGSPNSKGVSEGTAKDTLIAQYNDLDSVRTLFENNKDEIACVIVEPTAANMGVVLAKPGFLQGLRDICTQNKALLIFDEVITGFRLALGGAAEYFGVQPDIVTYGKIIGGGMPVGAYAASRELMENITPTGQVYQAGTLSGNPIAMAAGIKTLSILSERPEIYENINRMGKRLADGIKQITKNAVNHTGSLLSVFFTENEVYDCKTAQTSDLNKYAKFFNKMLDNGIYMAPAQFEAMFVSNAHTDDDIDYTLEVIEKVLKEIE